MKSALDHVSCVGVMRRASVAHFAALHSILGMLAAASTAGAGSIPVSGNLAGSGAVDIGTLDVQPDNVNGGMNIDFTFDPAYAFLDEWYDFQWVQLVDSYTINGVAQNPIPVIGALPGIDPQIGQNVPGALPDPPAQGDSSPYYYNSQNWDTGVFGPDNIHTEGTGSRFVDYRAGHPAGTVITFHTYLVASSDTDPSIGATEFCILGGIEWTYTQNTGGIEWTASLLAGAGNAASINGAIANANPAFPAGWTALSGCTFSECPWIWDCVFTSVPGVTFSPSQWTYNGATIGITFPEGITPIPGVPVYDGRYVPVVPNDWHWSVTYTCDSIPMQLTVAVVNFPPQTHLSVQLLCSQQPYPPLMLAVNYGQNMYQLGPQGGPPFWQGQWSQYPGDIPPNFGLFPVGMQRQNFIAPPTGLIINEVRIDQTGTDNDEYFELRGPPGMPLSGLTYLVLGDGAVAAGSGVIEVVVPLNGVIPPSGHFVCAESTFTLGTADLIANLNFENDDNVTHLLVQGFTGANGQDLDTNDDGVLDFTPWNAVRDLIALVKSPNPPTGTERHYGPPAIGPDGAFVPGHAYRCVPDGIWRIGAFDPSFSSDTPNTSNLPCVLPPPPSGACCSQKGTCFLATQSTCVAFGGTYQGDNSECGTSRCAPPCPSDVNGDGQVGVTDLLAVINSWGPCAGCAADVTGDDQVGVADLLAVIAGWGPCP